MSESKVIIDTLTDEQVQLIKQFARGLCKGIIDAGREELLEDYWYAYSDYIDVNIYQVDDGSYHIAIYGVGDDGIIDTDQELYLGRFA
jgi:hypothetical protein